MICKSLSECFYVKLDRLNKNITNQVFLPFCFTEGPLQDVMIKTEDFKYMKYFELIVNGIEDISKIISLIENMQ